MHGQMNVNKNLIPIEQEGSVGPGAGIDGFGEETNLFPLPVF